MAFKSNVVVGVLGILISSTAFSTSAKNLHTKPSLKASGVSVKIPECHDRPVFLSQTGTEIEVSRIPKIILVGKNVEHYVESKNSKLKLHGVQSFIKGTSKIICGTARQREDLSFSMYAPTVIDFSSGKGISSAVWQFQMMANPKEFGLWNQKSRILSRSRDLQTVLQEIGGKAQIFQVSQNEYEILISKEAKDSIEFLSIRFDAVNHL